MTSSSARALAADPLEHQQVRDLILLAGLLGVLPLMLRAPIVGLLAWIWTSLMNPQREVYGLLMKANLNFCIAALTMFAWLLSKDRKITPLNPLTILLVVFAGWITLTTFMALDRSSSYFLWDRTIKSIVLALVVSTLGNTKLRLQAILWIVVISLGFYGVKGGAFVLATGGRHHVYGPADSMIADNNCLGLALVMTLPLVNYLWKTSAVRFTRFAALVTIGCSFIAIFGTYSRGALLTLAAAGAAYAMRSRGGILLVLFAGVVAATIPSFMPAKWMDRMSTIQSADTDASFAGRVQAWKTSYSIALHRPVGGGFSAVKHDFVAQQFPIDGGLTAGRAAHSIYFEVLGDHGFIGLALYLLILAAAWLNTWRTLVLTRERPDLAWANLLARMLQVSMIAFLVGGAALSMAYYDGLLIVLALTSCLLQVVRAPSKEQAAELSKPRWKQASAPNAVPTES